MKTATRKTKSRKARRVATVFTGVAGLAVAFGPAAQAAPGHAAAQGHSARANGKTQAMAPDAQAIKSEGCTTNTWMHVQYQSVFLRQLCKQFGYMGYMGVPGHPRVNAQCGGNNVGWIFYSGSYYPGGKVISFREGNYYRNTNWEVSDVSIDYWSGNDKCAWPR